MAESVERILASSVIRVIPQSRGSFLAGLDLYRARPDKGYSLADCISMQTMRKEGLTEALTNDRHFEQEGFGCWGATEQKTRLTGGRTGRRSNGICAGGLPADDPSGFLSATAGGGFKKVQACPEYLS